MKLTHLLKTLGLSLAVSLSTAAVAGKLDGVNVLNLTGITESSLTDGNMSSARSLLTGEGATITDLAIGSFSAASLTGVDVLYVGLTFNGFNASQISAINSYVNAGGGLVAVGTERACCFGSGWEQLANSFGLTGLGGDRNVKATATTPSSSIVNGAFGVASSYQPAATGAFADTLPGGATVVWEGVDNHAVIVTLDVVGRAFFFADTNFMQNAYIGNGSNRTIWGNAFAFTAAVDDNQVPEPAGLALLGAALLAAGAARRRKA